eukprot:gene15134-32098_t
MELVTEYQDKPKELETILNHIKILCGNDNDMYSYAICWLAQLIQCPDLKSIVLVLISKEGAGKSSLVVLLTYILGASKVLETAKPSRDVWGDFNGQMKDAFFVNLNELSLKEMEACEAEFKNLVTEPTITINEKGVSQYSIMSHHRFLITSNKEIPVKPGRRTVLIRSSDELIGNKEYFDDLYKIINDVNVQKTFYEYLKNYTFEGKDMKTVEKFGKELLNDFETWRSENRLTYSTTAQKLGVSISYLSLKGVTKGRHTMNGDSKYYNIPLLKEHFKIGNCEVSVNDYNTEENEEDIEYIET